MPILKKAYGLCLWVWGVVAEGPDGILCGVEVGWFGSGSGGMNWI